MENIQDYIRITACRLCGSEALRRILSLGNQYVVDFPDKPETDKPRVELNLMFCEKCNLVQLEHTVNPTILFSKFWYRSGINEQMRSALEDIVTKSITKAKLTTGDAICDIGCNDGTMLEMFPKSAFVTVGFDPSDIINSIDAQRRMKIAINEYFDRRKALGVCSHIGKKFKLITAIAMFYDLNDPAEFLQDCKSVMTDDGLLVIQMNYLMSMINNHAVDNVCHEHLTYFSLTTLRWLLNKVGLDIIDVETNDVNGGSIRAYIKKVPLLKDDVTKEAFNRIKDLLQKEKEFGVSDVNVYINFGRKIKDTLETLLQTITKISLEGNPVYAYGASTRGTVLLQSTPMPLPLAGVAERDEHKFNKYMVANWLSIHPEVFVRERTKFMLVLPWHFKQSIIEREKEWLNNGGTLVFPLPNVILVTKNGEESMVNENKTITVGV